MTKSPNAHDSALAVPMNHDVDLSTIVQNQFRDQRLLETRTVFMSEGVTSNTARKIVSDLLILDKHSNDPINFMINSPGGEVNSGFAIYDTIRFIKSPVRIVNVGLCASIATIINIAVSKEHRFSLPNTRFLIHQPLIMGQIYGQASDLEITANQIVATRDKLNRLLSEACGQKFEDVEKHTGRDYWMNPVEALEYGLIGKIIDSIGEVS
jgi:ATP-dependent Clp protease protease subunit